MCKRVERICQVDPEGWYAPVVGEELVRCKDCKWYMEREWIVGGGSYIMCTNSSIANAKEDDFCSRAERKEE